MKKTYATLDELMDEIYHTIGVEFAPDYDVYAIAEAVYAFEDGDMVADLERDDFWLIVAEHDLTEDWRGMVGLPDGVDADVRAIVNACTWVVRSAPTSSLVGLESVSEWFGWCRKDGGTYRDTYEYVMHIVNRARVTTSEWRNAASPLVGEMDRLSAWYEACRLCEYKGADMTDSRVFCRALNIVESDLNWFFHCILWK